MRITLLAILLCNTLLAQQQPDWDTLCYQKFRSNLIVGLFQSYRNFNNTFSLPISMHDSPGTGSHDYTAESRQITGIDITFDKFSLALGLKSAVQDGAANRDDSRTFSSHFRVGGNKWQVENTIRYFKGFYDLQTARYDSTLAETGHFYFQPAFVNTLVRTKFLYFTNHRRFSVRSGYSCNYRQVRSAASWVLSANINHNALRNDTSFFPLATRPLYGDHAGLEGLRVLGLSANGGGAFSLVLWRALFLQLLLIAGPEQQWRTYLYHGRRVHVSYLSLSGEVRLAVGLNFRRWYLVSFSSNDFAVYNSSFMNISNKSLSGGLIIGYRFNTKMPAFYERFQQTSLYKAL